MSEKFILATANTFLGRTSRVAGGLDLLKAADVLLLQEVVNPKKDKLKERLAERGFILVHAAGKFGLAIALRSESNLHFVKNSTREHELAKIGFIERTLLRPYTKSSHELRERGVIAAKLSTQDGFQLTVASAHPSTNIAPRRRAREIIEIGKELDNPYYSGPLILGADMNYYPKPKAVDLAMWANARLTPVELAGEPTWRIRGSKYEKYARVANLFSGKTLESYDGQLDIMLYRGREIKVLSSEVIDIPSDHRAIMTTFAFTDHAS